MHIRVKAIILKIKSRVRIYIYISRDSLPTCSDDSIDACFPLGPNTVSSPTGERSVIVIRFCRHGRSATSPLTDVADILHVLPRFVEAPPECDVTGVRVHFT